MFLRLKGFIKSILKNVFGIQILRVRHQSEEIQKPKSKMKYVHDPAYSYMIDQAYQDMLADELSAIARGFFNQNYFMPDSNFDTNTAVKKFFQVYKSRTLTDNTHGSGFHNAFWIFLIAQALNPTILVESGVWKGHTTWLLSQACPTADLYGFDRTLKHLEYKDLRAKMYEHDWKTFQFPSFDPERSLVFFDCHVNHAQRLLEAKSKGFKHILFDDNPPPHKIFSHIPGIPTAAMLFSGQGLEKSEISWFWNDQEVIRSIDLKEAQQAKKLINVHHLLPDVGGPTRYGGFAFLTYVQI